MTRVRCRLRSGGIAENPPLPSPPRRGEGAGTEICMVRGEGAGSGVRLGAVGPLAELQELRELLLVAS